jgi:hypothetical protein
MQPWQHLAGSLLSAQSSDSSGGHVVRQSHFDLSAGQVNLFSLFISQTAMCLLQNYSRVSLKLQVASLAKPTVVYIPWFIPLRGIVKKREISFETVTHNEA